MQNLEITFHLDGTGVYADRYEPTHLDALIMWAQCEREGLEAPSRDQEPKEIMIPVDKWDHNGAWGWRASALFPVDLVGESLRFIRRRIRWERMQMTGGASFVTGGGEYMTKNIPIPISVTTAMIGWVRGDKDKVEDLLSDVRYIGRYTSGWIGNVNRLEVKEIESDYSCVKDGKATRHLPKADGFRLCRPRPPYWNSFGRVNVCEVGEVLR